MALIHNATLRPNKLELLSDWLPSQSWYTTTAGDLARVAAYRFDDPAGAVGIETLLVRAGDGPVHQVPLTYRETPMAGGDDLLVGTSEHSVLGKRWIYDATGDPVYAAALASALLENTGQAEQLIDVNGQLEARALDMNIASNAVAGAEAASVGAIRRVENTDRTLIVTDALELTVIRRLDAAGSLPEGAGEVLTGTWPGQAVPLPLAYVTV